ncbi:putative ADP-ribosylation factor-like protein 4C-like [Apostichopus japonicus]|uniref:Putative ADP-ribosylation factor-like protein 4C-like n=1 Tax=Stichopus japonicus TaxID=307972 RepID=A0A2G8KGU0_STIJA|nr:putative ADP-ribosylation factor-like protein 4C-like [Apostichopus japonicus]
MMKGGILRTVSDLGNEISYQARGILPSNTHQIAVIGLDKSGKTTFLYRLHLNEFIHTVPTIGFNSEKIKSTSGKSKGQSFQFWDAGGQEKLRPYGNRTLEPRMLLFTSWTVRTMIGSRSPNVNYIK